MSATLLFCIWLVPAASDYKPLSQDILAISKKYDFPYYEPHATLFCGETPNNEETLKNNFNTLFQDTKKLTLKTNGIEVGSQYYRNFYIRLQSDASIEQLKKIAKTLDEKSMYQLNPHISLSYGLPQEEISPYAAQYTPLESITFDQITLYTDSADASNEAILSWKPIDTINLS